MECIELSDSDLDVDLDVEQIIAHRTIKGGEVEYLVTWSSGDEESWEPGHTFPIEELHLVAEYWAARGEEPPAADCAPEAVEARRTVKGGAQEVLVRWAGGTEKKTWEAPSRKLRACIARFEAEAAADESEETARQEAERQAARQAAAAERAAARVAAEKKAAADIEDKRRAAEEKAAADRAAEAEAAAAANVAAEAKAAAEPSAAEATEPTPAATTSSPPASSSSSSACAGWIGHLPAQWRLGVIIGPMASGKSRAIDQLRAAGLVLPAAPAEEWPKEQSIISVIAGTQGVREEAAAALKAAAAAAAAGSIGACLSAAGSSSSSSSAADAAAPAATAAQHLDKCSDVAIERLGCVGLNSLPVWLRPHAALSNGQRARAHVACALRSGLALDDFGTTVDARNASVCAAGIARSVRFRKLERVVVASAHEGLLPWMGADWAYFPATGEVAINPAPGGKPAVSVRYDEGVKDSQFAKDPANKVQEPPALLRATKSTAYSVFGASAPRLLRASVQCDAATDAISSAFQYTFSGECEPFVEPSLPRLREGWRLGLLVGPSGTGKSTVLRRLVQDHAARSGASPVRSSETFGGEGGPPDEGQWRLDAPAVGALPGGAADLVPFGHGVAEAAASRPFHELSRGERTLLALARLCTATGDGTGEGGAAGEPSEAATGPSPLLALADEFTSHVDRPRAAAAARATRALWMRRAGSDRLVCASVHADVVENLKPDWTYETLTRKLTQYAWHTDDLAADAACPPPPAEVPRVPPSLPLRASGSREAALFEMPTVEVIVRQTDLQPEERGASAGSRAEEASRLKEATSYKEKLWELFKVTCFLPSPCFLPSHPPSLQSSSCSLAPLFAASGAPLHGLGDADRRDRLDRALGGHSGGPRGGAARAGHAGCGRQAAAQVRAPPGGPAGIPGARDRHQALGGHRLALPRARLPLQVALRAPHAARREAALAQVGAVPEVGGQGGRGRQGRRQDGGVQGQG